jgi:hypothetical protein
MKLTKTIIAIISAIICIVGFRMISANDTDAIADAKSIVWKGDGVTTVSIGDMCDLIFKDQDWSSNKINKTMYDVTVVGTVENDIPAYRKYAGQSVRATFEVDYYGDHFELQYVDGSFPGDTDPSIKHMYAMWKICSGNYSPVTDNPYTTNTKFPIYEMNSKPTPTTKSTIIIGDTRSVHMEQYTPGEDISAQEAAGDDLGTTAELSMSDLTDENGNISDYMTSHIYNLLDWTLDHISNMAYKENFKNVTSDQQKTILDFFNSNSTDPPCFD